jgi:serine/threonine-protein kinase RsbW
MPAGMLTLRIESRLDHVFLVGWALRGLGDRLALDESAAAALELCVVEAVNNAVEHAYGGQAGHVIEIEIELAAEALRITVRDRGAAVNWESIFARGGDGPGDPLAEGGRGLFIMRSLMDELAYARRDGWNAVTMTKRLAAPPAAPWLRPG